MNLAGLGNLAEKNVRSDPSCPPRRCGQRLPFFDDVLDEEMLGDDEQVDDGERLKVVVHQKQVRIVLGGKAFALRLECAIYHSRAEFSLLAFEFELLPAGRTKEIGQRAVVGERGDV